MRWAGSCSATCRRIRITSASSAQGFQTLERDVDVRTSVPIDVDLTLALAGATTDRRGRRPRRGSARTRSDGAHRHRSEPDRQAADRVVVRAEPGRSRSRRPASSPMRTASSIRSAITRRRSSRSTTSRSPISRAGSIRTRFRRTPCSRWKSSPACRRRSSATRTAWSCASSRSRASTSRSRPAASRPATDRSRARAARSISARAIARSATFCRSAACGPIAFSIRRSSRRCTTTATASRSSIAWTSIRATPTRCT